MIEQPLIQSNGQAYGNYNYIEIVSELGVLPATFYCSYSNFGQPLPKSLDTYTISLNGVIIQKGTILFTSKKRTADKSEANIYDISGSDNSFKFHLHSVGQLPIQENTDFISLANLITNGLGVNITSTQSSMKINRIKCRPDETVFNVLRREANRFGVLVYSDGINCIIDKEGSGITHQASIIDSRFQGNAIATEFTKDHSRSFDSLTSTIFDYISPTTLSENRTQNLFGINNYFYSKDYYTAADLQNSLKWIMKQNQLLENTYKAIIPLTPLFLSLNNQIPKVGDYIFVEDDSCKIKGKMLIYKTRIM